MQSLDQKVYFIGKLPLPLGGVTVFNERKVAALRSQGHEVCVVEPSLRNLPYFFKALLDYRSSVLLSASNIRLFFLVLVFGLARRTYFYDHNASRDFAGEGPLYSRIRKAAVSRFRQVLLVDGHLRKNYQIFPFFERISFSVESAFIPPVLSSEEGIISSYPEQLQTLLRTEERRFVIASAFRPNLDAEGRDIYGLEETIRAFQALSHELPQCHFLVAIAQFGPDEFSARIRQQLEELVASRTNVSLLGGQSVLWPFFRKGALFLRPTTTDGDSVSVREALYFGCPVIASDVVPRPAGVMTFPLGGEDLLAVVRQRLVASLAGAA